MKLELELMPKINTVEYSSDGAGKHSFLSVFNFYCNTSDRIVSLLQLFYATYRLDGDYYVGVKDVDFFTEMLHRKLKVMSSSNFLYTQKEVGDRFKKLDIRDAMVREFKRIINDDDYRINCVRENWNKYIASYLNFHHAG